MADFSFNSARFLAHKVFQEQRTASGTREKRTGFILGSTRCVFITEAEDIFKNSGRTLKCHNSFSLGQQTRNCEVLVQEGSRTLRTKKGLESWWTCTKQVILLSQALTCHMYAILANYQICFLFFFLKVLATKTENPVNTLTNGLV